MNNPNQSSSYSPPASDTIQTRTVLAVGITGIAIVGIVALGIVIIVAPSTEIVTRAQTVFNAVLPLFGTWVGTVLAYFFSKENFESATRSVERLTQISMTQKLQSVPVLQAMIPVGQLFVSQDPDSDKLMDLMATMEAKHYRRLPILKKDNSLVALLFREDIFEFLYRDNAGKADDQRKALTVSNLLADAPGLKKPYGLVGEKDTLAEAQDAMQRITDCSVVFVVRDRSEKNPILGMLTSTDVAKNAQM